MTSERDVSGPRRPIGLAVVGAGYWGPNLVRNFAGSPRYRLAWLCDLDKSRAVQVLGPYSTVGATDDLDVVRADERVAIRCGAVRQVTVTPSPCQAADPQDFPLVTFRRHRRAAAVISPSCPSAARRAATAAAERARIAVAPAWRGPARGPAGWRPSQAPAGTGRPRRRNRRSWRPASGC